MTDLSATRLFVFDFDGTLVQSNAIKRAAFYEVTAEFPGSGALLDELLQADPPLDRYGICRVLAARLPGIDPEALAAAYTAHCEAQIAVAPEVPGAFDLLAALKERGRTSVISSATPETPLRALVSRLPIAPLVGAVYGRPASKPENMRRAMAWARVSAPQAVVIGDGEADRRAAIAAGCAFVGVESDNNDFAAPTSPLVARLDQLIGWL